METISLNIQIITIIITFCFLAYIGKLVIKGKLREEYSFVWIIVTIILVIFSFWRNGLEVIAKMLGVYAAPNLVFMAAIFVIFIYLIHLSVVVSKLQSNNKELAQKIAFLQNKIKEKEMDNDAKK